jgi:hypothetical protein
VPMARADAWTAVAWIATLRSVAWIAKLRSLPPPAAHEAYRLKGRQASTLLSTATENVDSDERETPFALRCAGVLRFRARHSARPGARIEVVSAEEFHSRKATGH